MYPNRVYVGTRAYECVYGRRVVFYYYYVCVHCRFSWNNLLDEFIVVTPTFTASLCAVDVKRARVRVSASVCVYTTIASKFI